MKSRLTTKLLLVAAIAVASIATVTATATAEGRPSASGHGFVRLESGRPAFLTFVAKVLPGGATIGHAVVHDPFFEDTLHLDIDCMLIVGNIAVMSGVIVSSANPTTPVGGAFFFAVEDNGQGAADPADLSTNIFFFGPDPVPGLCDLVGPPPPAFLFPVEGNYSVNP